MLRQRALGGQTIVSLQDARHNVIANAPVEILVKRQLALLGKGVVKHLALSDPAYWSYSDLVILS